MCRVSARVDGSAHKRCRSHRPAGGLPVGPPSGARERDVLACCSGSTMRRRVIAAVWIVGATVPLLLGTVFLVGCCVLPFHHIVHKLMPVCEMAVNAVRGDHGSHDSTPAREKEAPAKRIVTTVPRVYRLAVANGAERAPAPAAATAY